MTDETLEFGGEGSGNWGHAGIPGQIGVSAGGGGGAGGGAGGGSAGSSKLTPAEIMNKYPAGEEPEQSNGGYSMPQMLNKMNEVRNAEDEMYKAQRDSRARKILEDKVQYLSKQLQAMRNANKQVKADALAERESLNTQEEQTESHFAELSMEIFSTGKWNGDEYSEKDLDEIVKSYNELGGRVKPYLKLGHNETQKLAKQSGFTDKDGKPSLGWLDGLQKQGNKLIARFKDVPKVIAELVNKGAYKRVSSEIYFNYEIDKKKYPLVLKAVALLGGETPAVTNLNDVLAWYSDDDQVQFKTVEFDKNFKEDDEKMAEEKTFEEEKVEMEKKFAEKEAELETMKKEYAEKSAKFDEVVKLFEGADDLRKAVLDFQDQQKKVADKEKHFDETMAKVQRDEIKVFVSTLIKDNKILPFQQKMVEEILFTLQGNEDTLEFAQAELYGLKSTMSLPETVRALLSSNPDMGMLKEYVSQNKIITDKNEEAELLVKKYQDENKVTYGEAQLKIAEMRPELFELNLK